MHVTICPNKLFIIVDDKLNVFGFHNSVVSNGFWGLEAVYVDGASYQWYDCSTNEALVNEFSPSFQGGIGSYKVEITIDGCSVFSECESIVGESIHQIYNSRDLELAPNPNNGSFTVSLLDDSKINSYKIINMLGVTIENSIIENNNSILIETNFDSGIYFIRITTNDKLYMKQFVVQ